MKKEYSRRDFIISTGKILFLGLMAPVGSIVIPPATRAAETAKNVSWEQIWEGKEWGFVVDYQKCIGCGRCVMACKQENGVPLDKEVYRTWVERYTVGEDHHATIDSPKGGLEFNQGDLTAHKQFFVPKLCNQCQKTPCSQVCPVGATYVTGDGVVLVDRKRCIGCGYCIQACPYGARFLHPELKVADKCTWCYHRITKGMMPACVQICPKKVRKFGNLKDHDSEVATIIKNDLVRVLKGDMGTEPNLYYINLEEVVV